MTDLFEPAFVERQQALFPRLDVRIYAAVVREWRSRAPVRNPNGLLVHLLTQADRGMRARIGELDAAEAAEQAIELDRYAALWVTLLGLVATRALSPAQIRRCIEAARAEGYPKLNARISDRLARMGDAWPAPARAAAIGFQPTAQGPGASHREG